jgi:protein phosphatase
LAIVCDGIGSQDDSQIASLMTVEVFKKAFEKHSKVHNINVFFFKCLKAAHNQITQVSNARLNGKKIGTTLLVAYIKNNQVHVFNLGDTRLYHYSINSNT